MRAGQTTSATIFRKFFASGSVAAGAVTAGKNRAKINQLPELTGMKSEIIIQKVHRNSYDHAFRMVV